MRSLLPLALCAATLGAWSFPLEDLGEVRDLRLGNGVRLELLRESARLRFTGPHWSVSLPYVGGIWSARLLRGDWDASGSPDFWLQMSLPNPTARCSGLAQLYWIRLDSQGLPSVDTAISHGPHWIGDEDRDGRAEFRLRSCEGKILRRWEEDPEQDGLVQESDWSPLQELKADQALPEMVVRDGSTERHVEVEGTLGTLKRALRDGWGSAWMRSERGGTRWLWLDTKRHLLPPARVRAEYVIVRSKHVAAQPIREAGGWQGVRYEDARYLHAGDLYTGDEPAWWYEEGGWRIVAKWSRRVHRSSVAMGFRNGAEQRWEAPAGAGQMLFASNDLAQWESKEAGRGEKVRWLSLHDAQGKLLESRIAIAAEGRLVGRALGELAFWDGRGRVRIVEGYVRWSR